MQDILQQLSPILGNPALWLAVTLVAFIFGQHLYKLTQFNPLFTPIIVAVVSIIVVLLVMGVPYEQYFQGAGVIHFLLGPATVVLAVPLFEQRQKLVELWLPLTCGLLAGSVAAIVSVVAFGWLFGLSAETMISMIPKSVTTPIAMGAAHGMGTSAAFQISNRAGAFGGLAMGLSGIITAFLAPLIAGPLMKLLGI